MSLVAGLQVVVVEVSLVAGLQVVVVVEKPPSSLPGTRHRSRSPGAHPCALQHHWKKRPWKARGAHSPPPEAPALEHALEHGRPHVAPCSVPPGSYDVAIAGLDGLSGNGYVKDEP